MVAIKKGTNAISEKSGRGSPPNITFKDNDSIKAHITEVYKFKNFEKSLKMKKADNELKKTCVKITAKFISPKETIKNGTMNNWKIIGLQPRSLKKEIKKSKYCPLKRKLYMECAEFK